MCIRDRLFGFSGDEQEYSLTELLNGRVYPVENTVEDILLGTFLLFVRSLS